MKLREYIILAEHDFNQCGGWDSNPRTPTGVDLESFKKRSSEIETREKSSIEIINFKKYKTEWFEWCKRETPSMASKYKSYLERYLENVIISTPEELRRLVDEINNRHFNLAVRNFLRFLVKTGKRKQSEIIDFQAVVPNIPTRARAEAEKTITPKLIVEGYRSIIGEEEIKKIRQLAYKLLVFTGLRTTELIAFMNQFDPGILEKTYLAFNVPEEVRRRIAVYDLETVKIPTRKHDTKRGYIAIFPIELIPDLIKFKEMDYKMSYKVIEPTRMFTAEFVEKVKVGRQAIIHSLLRKFHYNFFNDNAFKVPEMPADVYRIIEFMQGRTHKDVGGRNYRANVQTAVKLYYHLVDEFKRTIPIL